MGNKIIGYNKYDIFIFVIIVSLIFGGYGDAFQVVRIIAIFMMPILLRKLPYCKDYTKTYVHVLGFFYLFAVVSIMWTGDQVEGLKALAYYPVHFLIFFEILAFSRYANKPLKSISLSWMIVVCLSLVIALWEIVTDNHLALSKFDSDLHMTNGLDIVKIHFAAVTFGNYNGYVTFICFALPFLFYCLLCSDKWLKKLMCLVPILLCLVVLLFNASRGGLLSFCIMSALYFIRTPKAVVKLVLLALFLMFLIPFIIENGSAMFDLIMMRAEDGGMFEDNVRSIIWGLCFKIVANTFGIGAGVMGTRTAMQALKAPVTIPHNMVLEIMADFGVLFALIFVVYVFKLFYKAKNHSDNKIKTMLYMSILAMPFYLIIDSAYLLNAAYYSAFASITVFANINVIRGLFAKRHASFKNAN